MKKQTLIAALLMAASTTAMADEYQYLTVAYNKVEQSIELATIKKITFENNLVVVTTTEGQVTFPQSEMEKMFFSVTPTAIKELPTESNNMQVSGNTLQVKGNGLLHIYSSNGTLVRMAKVEEQASISLGNLPKGIYIINLGNQTIKVTK